MHNMESRVRIKGHYGRSRGENEEAEEDHSMEETHEWVAHDSPVRQNLREQQSNAFERVIETRQRAALPPLAYAPPHPVHGNRQSGQNNTYISQT